MVVVGSYVEAMVVGWNVVVVVGMYVAVVGQSVEEMGVGRHVEAVRCHAVAVVVIENEEEMVVEENVEIYIPIVETPL